MIQAIAFVVLVSLVAPRRAVDLPAEPAVTPTLQMYSKVTVKQPEGNAADYEEAGVSRQADVREETHEPSSSSLLPGAQGEEGPQNEKNQKREDETAEGEALGLSIELVKAERRGHHTLGGGGPVVSFLAASSQATACSLVHTGPALASVHFDPCGDLCFCGGGQSAARLLIFERLQGAVRLRVPREEIRKLLFFLNSNFIPILQRRRGGAAGKLPSLTAKLSAQFLLKARSLWSSFRGWEQHDFLVIFMLMSSR
ncbi:hypothetical protein Esti_000112 [Eimeria stiedai]